MVSRTSVRISMTPHNHQSTYPENFTNVWERSHTTAQCKSQPYYYQCINVENTRSISQSTHATGTDITCKSYTRTADFSFGFTAMVHYYHEANSSHAQSCNKNSDVWKTDRRPPCDKNYQSKISSSSERISTLAIITWRCNSMQLSHQIVIPSYGIVASSNWDITASLLLKNPYFLNKRLRTSCFIILLSNNRSYYGHINTRKCIRRKLRWRLRVDDTSHPSNRSGREALWFVSSLVINDDPLAN